MTVKQRLTEYIEFKKITKIAFCKAIGVSNGFISSMRKSIQPDKIKSIALNFPDLNTGWLLTGEGKMIKESAVFDKETENGFHVSESHGGKYQKNDNDIITMPREVFEMLNKLTDTVQSQQRTIELLERQNK